MCRFKVSHVLPCLGGEKAQQGWRRNGELDVWEGRRTKSAELDYIRLSLSGSVPYKSLASLKGLHRR